MAVGWPQGATSSAWFGPERRRTDIQSRVPARLARLRAGTRDPGPGPSPDSVTPTPMGCCPGRRQRTIMLAGHRHHEQVDVGQDPRLERVAYFSALGSSQHSEIVWVDPSLRM